jgi:hypothetical protein
VNSPYLYENGESLTQTTSTAESGRRPEWWWFMPYGFLEVAIESEDENAGDNSAQTKERTMPETTNGWKNWTRILAGVALIAILALGFMRLDLNTVPMLIAFGGVVLAVIVASGGKSAIEKLLDVLKAIWEKR